MTDENLNPMAKFDAPTLKGMAVRAGSKHQGGFLPATMAEAMEMAKLMASSNFVPAHLRGKAGDCLAVVIQATRWDMDPFAVGSKTYFVNGNMGYEAQLLHAVVNSRAPLKRRLRMFYDGEGQTRRCKVLGMLEGEVDELEYQSPTIAEIAVKNSPLWKGDPDQQLHYYAVRAWSRRHVPEVLLGVYSRDELEAGGYGPEHARDVTPTPRPTRAESRPYELYDEAGALVETVYSPDEWRSLYAGQVDRAGDKVALELANADVLAALGMGGGDRHESLGQADHPGHVTPQPKGGDADQTPKGASHKTATVHEASDATTGSGSAGVAATRTPMEWQNWRDNRINAINELASLDTLDVFLDSLRDDLAAASKLTADKVNRAYAARREALSK